MKKITTFLVMLAFMSFSNAQQLTYMDFGITTNTTPGNWNNIAVANAASASGITLALIDSNGASTGVTLTIDDAFNTVNTGGNASPDPSLPFPSSAAADSFFGSTVTFQGALEPTGGFILTGLDPTKFYSFSIFASRNGVSDNRETLYTVTGLTTQTATLDASNNTDNTAEIFDIVPNVSGEITFRAEPGPNNSTSQEFYYLGAIEMTRTDTPLSVNDFEISNGFTIFPNPSTDQFTISFKMNEEANVSVIMYDINGRMVTSIFNDNISSGAFEYTWNRTSATNNTIASGLYIVEVTAGGRKISKKLILE